MTGNESFISLKETERTEIKVRGSRFIATAVPVSSKEQAMLELGGLRKEFWDATHNCYAYRLAPDGAQYRFSDDGEPSGSAGKPILFVMQQRNLVDVLVVVTRYFGGTKLGVGGLVRAYGDATTAVLDQARLVEIVPTTALKVLVPYDDMQVVRRLVEEYALRFQEEFHDVVSYLVDVPVDLAEEFSERITSVSHGRAGVVQHNDDRG